MASVAPVARAAALALAAVAGASCAGGSQAVEPLPPPPSTAARPSTTAPPDYRGVALPVAPGARATPTPAAVMGPGTATVRGRVVGPDGAAVVGANVRVERLVGSAVATTDLLSGEDGAWSLPNVLGGRYRIRAWRPPDLAMIQPGAVFVEARATAPVEQRLERHFGATPVPAIAPNPPVVGQPANLVIQVTVRNVGADGVVRGQPVAFTPVELAAGTWSLSGPNPTATDAAGRVRWEVTCRASGAQPLRLVLNGNEQFAVALSPCRDAPTPRPSTSLAPGATTTTRPGVTTTRPAAPPPPTRSTPPPSGPRSP